MPCTARTLITHLSCCSTINYITYQHRISDILASHILITPLWPHQYNAHYPFHIHARLRESRWLLANSPACSHFVHSSCATSLSFDCHVLCTPIVLLVHLLYSTVACTSSVLYYYYLYCTYYCTVLRIPENRILAAALNARVTRIDGRYHRRW